MTKDEFNAFCEDLTLSLEEWFKYNGEIYFIQGYFVSETKKLCLTIGNVTSNKDVWERNVPYDPETQNSLELQETNVKAFLMSPLFNGKTFIEIYPEVKWLFYDEDDDDQSVEVKRNTD